MKVDESSGSCFISKDIVVYCQLILREEEVITVELRIPLVGYRNLTPEDRPLIVAKREILASTALEVTSLILIHFKLVRVEDIILVQDEYVALT